MSEHDVQGEVQQPGSIDEFFGVLHDHLHVDCDGLRVDGTLTQRDLEDLALDIFSDCTSLLPEQIIAAAKAVTHDRFLREQSPDASVRHVVDVTTGIAQFTTVHPDAILALAQRTDVLSRSYDYISRLVAGQTMYRPESRHHKHERRFRTHLLGGFVAHLERLEMPATLLREDIVSQLTTSVDALRGAKLIGTLHHRRLLKRIGHAANISYETRAADLLYPPNWR